MAVLGVLRETKAEMGTQEARLALQEALARRAMSQTEAAKAIGVSNSTLSGWIRGTYQGDVEAVTQRVVGWLGLAKARENAPTRVVEFVETAVAAEILEVCRYAHVHRDIGLVYGEAGMGKTVAARHYAREHRDAVYVRCDPSVRNPTAALSMLLQGLGRKARAVGLYALTRELVDALEGTGRVLLLDEAQFLSHRSLEVMRTIHDQAEVGLVLIGNLDIWTQLHGHGHAAFAQIFSRVGIRRLVQLGAPREDIARLAASIASGPVPEDCVKHLQAKACERGGLRRMVKVLRLAAELAVSEDVPIGVRHLQMAEAMLIGGQAVATG